MRLPYFLAPSRASSLFLSSDSAFTYQFCRVAFSHQDVSDNTPKPEAASIVHDKISRKGSVQLEPDHQARI